MMSMRTLAGRYELHALIGEGGYGEVWRGMDTVLARPVAVKLLQAEHAVAPEAMARFRAEARHAGGLSHPCIAHVYDYCEPAPPDPPFLVMELVDGPSLAELLSRGPVGVPRTMDILAQAAEGLQAAHQAGLVHRDIKPGNLLVSRDGPVKITDFGIAHAAAGRVLATSGPVTLTGMVLGTVGYMAPERVAGARATVASDVYALGVVAHECLAGIAPQSDTPLQPGSAPYGRPLPPLPPAVPVDVASLVRRLTAADPAARPASAGEVARQAAALRDKYADIGTDTRTAPDGPRLDDVDWDSLPLDGSGRDGSGRGRAARGGSGQDAAAWAGAGRNGAGRDGLPVTGPDRRRTSALALAGPAALLDWRSWRDWRDWRSPGRAGLAVMAAAVLGLATLTFGAILALHLHGSAAVTASTDPPVRLVTVSAPALTGEELSVARRQLRGLGLGVRVIWQDSPVPAGLVLAVRPTGRVPVGSVVILTVAELPGETGPGSHSPATGLGPPTGKRPSHSPSAKPSPDASPSISTSPSGTASPSPSDSSTDTTSPSPSPSDTTSQSPV